MSHTAGDSSGSIDPVEVSEDAILLDRDIEVRAEGIVITYRLTTNGAEPATTTVSDEIPASLSMDDAGFHPDNEPYEWSIDDHDVMFETVVPEEGERIVVFGIAHSGEDLGDLAFPDPVLSGVDSINPAVAGDDMDITLPDVDEPDRADAIAEVIQGRSNSASADGGDSPEASSDEIEAALEGLADTNETAPPESPDDSDVESDFPQDTSETIELDEDAASPDPEPDVTPTPDGSLIEGLIEELQQDGISESDRATLADLLLSASEGPTPESLDVRVSHVQTRMDDYAAYADALEAIIDEYGTADGFMADIQESVDMVDERVEDIHERIDDIETEVETVSRESADPDDLAALSDEVGELRSDVQAVKQVRDTLLDAFGDTAEE